MFQNRYDDKWHPLIDACRLQTVRLEFIACATSVDVCTPRYELYTLVMGNEFTFLILQMQVRQV